MSHGKFPGAGQPVAECACPDRGGRVARCPLKRAQGLPGLLSRCGGDAETGAVPPVIPFLECLGPVRQEFDDARAAAVLIRGTGAARVGRGRRGAGVGNLDMHGAAFEREAHDHVGPSVLGRVPRKLADDQQDGVPILRDDVPSGEQGCGEVAGGVYPALLGREGRSRRAGACPYGHGPAPGSRRPAGAARRTRAAPSAGVASRCARESWDHPPELSEPSTGSCSAASLPSALERAGVRAQAAVLRHSRRPNRQSVRPAMTVL